MNWEYKTVKTKETDKWETYQDFLNETGVDGWELVSVFTDLDSEDNMLFISIWKRSIGRGESAG